LHIIRDVIFEEELGWEWTSGNLQPDHLIVQHEFTVEDPAIEAPAENIGAGGAAPPSPGTIQSSGVQ
jgi:hypothetical protein